MKRIAFLSIALAAMTAQGALAQAGMLGSRLPTPGQAPVERDALHAVRQGHAFAMCMAHQRTRSARIMLESTIPSEVAYAEKDASREISCSKLSGASHYSDLVSMSQPTDIMRGMVAEAFLHDRKDLDAIQPEAPQLSYATPYADVSGRNPVVEEMSVCVASRNPAAVVALLRTDPESAEEKGAIGAISPTLGDCLVNNAKLVANRQSLRAGLAEALYHRAAANGGAGGGQAKLAPARGGRRDA